MKLTYIILNFCKFKIKIKYKENKNFKNNMILKVEAI